MTDKTDKIDIPDQTDLFTLPTIWECVMFC
jgi:hypothetical protein